MSKGRNCRAHRAGCKLLPRSSREAEIGGRSGLSKLNQDEYVRQNRGFAHVEQMCDCRNSQLAADAP